MCNTADCTSFYQGYEEQLQHEDGAGKIMEIKANHSIIARQGTIQLIELKSSIPPSNILIN